MTAKLGICSFKKKKCPTPILSCSFHNPTPLGSAHLSFLNCATVLNSVRKANKQLPAPPYETKITITQPCSRKKNPCRREKGVRTCMNGTVFG